MLRFFPKVYIYICAIPRSLCVAHRFQLEAADPPVPTGGYFPPPCVTLYSTPQIAVYTSISNRIYHTKS